MKQQNSISHGFWLSYIDTITVLLSVFIILFSYYFYQARSLKLKLENYNKKISEFTKAWQDAEIRLRNMNAEPIIDRKWGGWRINIAENILFPINSADLTPEGMIKVKQITKILDGFLQNKTISKSIRIVVGGHTDRSGGDYINLPLSDNRANVIATILKDNVSAENVVIEAVGYGSKYLQEKEKIHPNSPKHRRITITIQPIAVEYF